MKIAQATPIGVDTIIRDADATEETYILSKRVNAEVEAKQSLFDSIEPLQQRVLQKWDGLASKYKRHEDCKKNGVTIKKEINDIKYKKALAWGIEVEAQNDDITIDNTVEEIQARIDRINELYNLFPNIE